MKITSNEHKVLRSILLNDFRDGNGPCAEIWADLINDSDEPSGIEGKALSGVVSSLAKKEWVVTNGRTISLTQTGVEASRCKITKFS